MVKKIIKTQPEREQIELGPWLSKFTLPSTPGVYTVTHDMAGDWLDYRVPRELGKQRKLSRTKVNQRRQEMNAGLWKNPCPPGLMFNMEGWCFNGQHTLQALRDSDLDKLDLWIFPDQPRELFSVVDTFYYRTAGQLKAGKYATTVVSAVRYLGDPIGKYTRQLTTGATLAACQQWPELETHAGAAFSAYLNARVPASPHLAILAQAERSPHRDDLVTWLAGITHGADLRRGDPRLQLVRRYIGVKGRMDRELEYNVIAKAWNLHVTGGRVQSLRWSPNEGVIKVIGYEGSGFVLG